MAMEYVLYCDATAILSGLECNKGIDEVLKDCGEYRRKGIELNIVDTSQMSEREIQADYLRAIQPSVRTKHPVRQIFGSRKRSGWLFGRGVPALIIQDPVRNAPEDVFPHRESDRIVTIHDALNRALSAQHS